MKIIGKVLITVLTIIIILAALELFLRWRGALSTDIVRYDKATGLNTLKPNSEFKVTNNCYSNTVNVNSQGFHETEFDLAKPDNVFRVVILGDSFVEARQVETQKIWHNILEQKLNELPDLNKKIEIYAFGLGGNGTYLNYLYLYNYALKYQPDLIVLAFLPANDFRDDSGYFNKIFDNQGNIKTKLSGSEKLIAKSVLLVWLDYKWQLAKNNIRYYFGRIFNPQKIAEQLPFDFQVFLKDYPDSWNKVWDLEEKLILAFKKTAQEHNSKFLIVSLPDIWRSHEDLLKVDARYGQYAQNPNLDFEKPEKILKDFINKENIAYFNLLTPIKEKIQKENQPTFYWPCDAHWNETGNLWAAQILFDFFKEGNGRELLNNN